MLGTEIIASTVLIISFILGWTYKIYIQPLKNELRYIFEKLDKDYASIKNRVIEAESDKQKFINELINLWNFQNIRDKFKDEIFNATNLHQKWMLPEGLLAIFISCLFVAIKNNILILKIDGILNFLIISDSFIILALIIQAFSYRDIIKKINMFKGGKEITEIYTIKDVFL